MPAEQKPAWEVRVYGNQRSGINPDLIAQTIIILGRELAAELKSDKEQEEKVRSTHVQNSS